MFIPVPTWKHLGKVICSNIHRYLFLCTLERHGVWTFLAFFVFLSHPFPLFQPLVNNLLVCRAEIGERMRKEYEKKMLVKSRSDAF
jgi:hypothetical protein